LPVGNAGMLTAASCTLPIMNHKRRIKQLQETLDAAKLDALLVGHLPNIRYLSGFTGSAGVLLVTPQKSVFFTDGRYTEQARAEVQGSRIVIAAKPPLVLAAEWLKSNVRRGGNSRIRIGLEGEHLVIAQRSRIQQLLQPPFRLVDTPPLVEKMRMVKDEDEIALLRQTAQLGSKLFDTTLATVRPGIKETEVAAEMEYAARSAGAESMSFSTIIASGSRSALPHARASEASVPSRGFVVCDFGVILTGYCSDRTRTLYVGRPTAEERSFYNAVRDAQEAALQVIRPGVSVAEIDHAARAVLKKNKLDRFFTHSTGHGVGLEIHEAPRVAKGWTDVLHAGMVITVEPGAYLPGKYGVRIEDMVAVTAQGSEVLAPTSKELITV
jgi:Xaa-Pro aminopeptidase